MLQTAPYTLSVEVDAAEAAGRRLLAPSGLSSPHGSCKTCTIAGGEAVELREAGTDQPCLLITPKAATVTISYSFEPVSAPYPAQMFTPLDSRYTRAADALLEEAHAIAPELSGEARQIAIARATAERFTYGHPEARFNDGLDIVPALGCGLTEGSCVDINTYFIASLRSAGIKAGYAVGPFFPAEKTEADGAAWCEDMHCWVVTRDGDRVLEWDIAHHLKLGTREIRPSLNPKPGFRFAVGHSMGLYFPEIAVRDLKLLSDPLWLDVRGTLAPATAKITCAPG